MDQRTVASAMLRRPKTLAADVTVGEVRALLGDDHVHVALLLDGTRLRGTVALDDLPADAADTDPALPLARLEGRTVGVGTLLADAHRLLEEAGSRRLAVVDGAGDLQGLLCLKRRRDGFCTDVGVAARRREREGRDPGS